MRLGTLLFLLNVMAVFGQPGTISFSPQQVITKNGSLMLWNVDVSAPGRSAIPAATVYAIAAAHGVGHMDAILANNILSAKVNHSVPQLMVQVLGAGSVGTALGILIKNGGVVSSGVAAKIQNSAVLGAGVSAVVLPYVQRAVPTNVNANIVLIGEELKLGSGGGGSGLFYSLPVNVGAFTAPLQ